MSDYITPRDAGAHEALLLFKMAKVAPITGASRIGAGIGGMFDTIGSAIGKGFTAGTKAFNRGSAAAGAAGGGAASQFLGGMGQAVSRGMTAFGRAGGWSPVVKGGLGAGMAYGAYRIGNRMLNGPQQQAPQPQGFPGGGMPARYMVAGY